MDIAIGFRHYTPTGASGLIIDNVRMHSYAPMYSEFSFDAEMAQGDRIDLDVQVVLSSGTEPANPIMLTVFEDGKPIFYHDSASLYSQFGSDWGRISVYSTTAGTHTYSFLFSVFNTSEWYNSYLRVDEVEIVRDAPPPELIDLVRVFGYERPYAGFTAEDLALTVPNGQGYEIEEAYFIDSATSEAIDANAPLVTGRSYLLRVALVPLEGYEFWEETQLVVDNCSDFSVTESTYTSIVFTVPVTITGLLGDVNCDGTVTMADVSALLAKVMNASQLSPEGLANADANRDGAVNILDAAAIYAIAFNT